MDEKDARIIEAVARAWSERGDGIPYDEIAPLAGLESRSAVHRRVTGKGYSSDRTGGGLIEHGWLVAAEGCRGRTLRPGPRFAGIDHGWPLEVIE